MKFLKKFFSQLFVNHHAQRYNLDEIMARAPRTSSNMPHFSNRDFKYAISYDEHDLKKIENEIPQNIIGRPGGARHSGRRIADVNAAVDSDARE